MLQRRLKARARVTYVRSPTGVGLNQIANMFTGTFKQRICHPDSADKRLPYGRRVVILFS